MQITLYNINKRVNSTRIPLESEQVLVADGTLNNQSGVLSPLINFAAIQNPANLNYAFIPIWGRYYHINEWTFGDGFWTAQMQVDVLATYRNTIGSSTQYVTRAASAVDDRITDTLYPLLQKPKTVQVVMEKKNFSSEYNYIVGIIGNGRSGTVTYYGMTLQEYYTFSAYLMSGAFLDGLDFGDLTRETIKAVLNPFQFITGIYATVLNIDRTSPVSSIPMGWYTIEATARPVGTTLFPDLVGELSCTIPKHDKGGFYRFAPYTKYILRNPLIGSCEIPAHLLADSVNLNGVIRCDAATGKGILTLTNDNNITVYQTPCDLSATLIVTQITGGNLGGVIAGTVNAQSAMLSGNFTGAASGILSAIGSLTPETDSKGTAGALAFLNSPFTLTATFYDTAQQYPEDFGRPLCKPVQINTLSGYLKCEDADISLAATADEIRSVKDYLNGGLFYE